ALCERLRCLVDVVIVQDDRGRLAAELQRAARDAFAADGPDASASGGRAGEADLVDTGIAYESLGDLPVRRDEVEYARGQADLLADLGEKIRRRRSLGRRLDDHGASRDEGGGRLVGHQRIRSVPGNDGTDDADGFAHERGTKSVGRDVRL